MNYWIVSFWINVFNFWLGIAVGNFPFSIASMAAAIPCIVLSRQ